MKKHFTRSLICLMLTFVMLLGMLPTVSASDADRTDLTVNFNPIYKSPEAAISVMQGLHSTDVSDPKNEGSIQWKHATHFDDDGGDLREYLFSTDPEDKYIVLDNDISAEWGWGGEGKSVGCVKITADKVLDLNGHRWKFRDIRNKVDTHSNWHDEYYQAENSKYFNTYLIEISNGATLTIIDSSETPTKKGTGEIFHDAYMIDPYQHNLKFWTTRDLFDVSNGNLIIYGGTFRAGRYQTQSDDDVWTELQTVIGEAVEFGTAVVEYSTGVSAAKAALDDTSFNLKDELKRVQEMDQQVDEPAGAQTNKPSGADPEAADKKQSTPEGAATGTNGRNPTVEEKQAAKNKEQEQQNNASRDGTQKTTVNSELAKAKNAVVTAATDKTKVKGMVDSGFKLASAIKGLFTTNEGSIVTQSFLGTAVHVGNNGTFVSYGGTYKGYGMTPNTRNAVVECTKKGKCYIYGGEFEANSGANVFNIVEANNTPQTKYQYVGSADNLQQVKIGNDETNGLVTIEMETDSKGNPVKDESGNYKMVDTSCIQVRGGTFKCYYEQAMVGLSRDKVEGSGDHNADKDKIMVFPGTPGGVNLGVESFNKDFIRDGRIQIVDTYGDGALVLADDKKGPQDKVYHHRLFCDDFELRIKKYLDVYPNKSQTNSTYSFALKTRWGGSDALPYNQKAEGFTNDAENERGPLSSDELFFTYPINSKYSEKYYVIPYMTDTDPWGENLGSSDVWYYNTPTDKDDKPIAESFAAGYDKLYITQKKNNQTASRCQNTATKNEWKEITGYIGKSDYTAARTTYSYQFQQKVKWFTYEVYEVDPLTRENIGSPVVKTTYGVSDDSLKCKLPLNKLGIKYQAGEMYRIVLNVSEYFSYAEDQKSLPTASCRSSIVFMCYDDSTEMKVEDTQKVPDYTPLQWTSEPRLGGKAQIELKNGWAGVVDYEARKIFDVYYQWYAVDDNGKETLIGGTDNVYTGEPGGLANHFFINFLPGRDGYKYVNTSPALSDDPREWTPALLHTYTDNDTPDSTLCKNTTKTLSRDNNNLYATSWDSLYITNDLAGKTIYCKAICVNSFWQKNYDHIQVFYSHRIKLPCDHSKNTNTGWETDLDYHWKECSVCGEVMDKEAHTWDSGTTYGGGVNYTCTKCGEKKTVKNGKTSVKYSGFDRKDGMIVGQPLPEIETQDYYGRAVVTAYQWYEGSVGAGNERKPGDIIKEDTTYCLTLSAKPTDQYYYEDNAYFYVSHRDGADIVVGENGSSISGVVTFEPDKITKLASATVTLPKAESGKTYGEFRKNVQFDVSGKFMNYMLMITEYRGDDETGELVAGTDAIYTYDCETKEWTAADEDGLTVAQMDALTFKDDRTYVVSAMVIPDIMTDWLINSEDFKVIDNGNAERIEPVDLIAPLAMGAEAFYYVEQPKDCGGDKSRCPSAQYTDVPKYGNWAHAGIDYCIRNGLMNGTSADKFKPGESMTRAMVVTVLWRQAGSPKPGAKAAFGDLKQDWYRDAVAWAAEKGVVNGIDASHFGPDNPVTREQMAAILQRYTANVLGKSTDKTVDISGYPDYSKVSSYAVAPMAWANAEGLITGSASGGKTYLLPKNGATREQVATILMRFVQNIA